MLLPCVVIVILSGEWDAWFCVCLEVWRGEVWRVESEDCISKCEDMERIVSEEFLPGDVEMWRYREGVFDMWRYRGIWRMEL